MPNTQPAKDTKAKIPHATDTKDRLIASATQLFAKNGIQWVSFQQIAQDVGVSQPALYRHFQDKDDLVLACALKAVERGRTLIDTHIDPYASAADQLKAYIDGNFLWAEKHREDAIIILAVYYFATTSHDTKNLFLTINERSLDRIGIKITAGYREGTWPTKSAAATEQAARLIHNILIGEIIKMIHSPKELSRKERVALVWKLVDALLS